MHRIKELGYETRRILIRGNIDSYGELLHEHWTNKRKLASNMSDPTIDEHYEAARAAGAIGGKLMGAGGGGFFVFYVENDRKAALREAMTAEGLQELRFHFDFEGSKVMVNF